jgi:hypothetical protein
MNLDSVIARRVRAPAPVVLSDGTLCGNGKALVTERDVVEMLAQDAFVSLAVFMLFSRQTADEQNGAYTKHSNAKGFNAFDAKNGTYWAQWVTGQSVRYPERTPSFVLGQQKFFLLSGKHLQRARTVLLKYRKQIANAINEM